jgi:hypothetical protein
MKKNYMEWGLDRWEIMFSSAIKLLYTTQIKWRLEIILA